MNERLPGSRFLAADLVECEQQVMLVCQLGRQLNLHLLVKLWSSGWTVSKVCMDLWLRVFRNKGRA